MDQANLNAVANGTIKGARRKWCGGVSNGIYASSRQVKEHALAIYSEEDMACIEAVLQDDN